MFGVQKNVFGELMWHMTMRAGQYQSHFFFNEVMISLICILEALLSCPTSSIHTEKPPKEIVEVQKMFPLPIDEQRLPVIDFLLYAFSSSSILLDFFYFLFFIFPLRYVK